MSCTREFIAYLNDTTSDHTITLNLLPISSGVFSNGICPKKMAKLMYECYTGACNTLISEGIQLINENALIHMRIYGEDEFEIYQKAFGQAL